jgi:LysR family transcriptional activator of nhaA
MRQHDVALIGRIDDVRERYYAISVERRLKHPAVVAISSAAELLLSPPAKRGRKKAAAIAE